MSVHQHMNAVNRKDETSSMWETVKAKMNEADKQGHVRLAMPLCFESMIVA